MLVNLVDIKKTSKFRKKIIFNIFKCVTNFRMIESQGYVGAGLPE